MKPKFDIISDLNRKNLFRFKNRILLFLILFIILSCCKQIELPRKFVNGEPFELTVGEILNISNNLSFSIDSVHDGRCPVGMYCFWPGDAHLFFNLNMNSHHIDSMICLNYCDTNPFQLVGYSWKVLDVNPYPDVQKEIDPNDIIIKMVVTKN